MRRVLVVIVVVAIAAAAGAWWVRQPQEAAPQAARVAAPQVEKRSESVASGPATVLAITPTRASTPSAVRVPVRSGPMQELQASKRYKGLWDRLRNTPEGATADGALALYRIASRCANVTDRPAWRSPNRGKTNDQVRDDFMKTLAPNDPQRDKRIAAFENVNSPRCEGIDVTMTQADLRAMLTKAADAGSAEARALALGQQVAESQHGRWDQRTLTDAQIDSLKQLAGTKDPGAMLEAGRILSNSYSDLTVRDGPDGPVLEPQALHNAWALLACEYGYPCGEDNTRVQDGCAYRGHCDASNLQDYLFFYSASPHDSQLMNQYEAILRTAVETGDWSHFTLVRGTRPPNAPNFIMGPQG
jgi:hypothetical protein